MDHTFETPHPVELYVELGRGNLSVTTGDTTQTTVTLSGKGADEVAVEQSGNSIAVIAPRDRAGFFGSNEPRLDVTVTIPDGSEVVTKTGSADQSLHGRYALAQLKAGSGDVRVEEVTGHLAVNTGSGDITVRACGGDLRVKSGSGDVEVVHAASHAGVSTGSGNISLGHTEGAVLVKSGSGDLGIRLASGDVTAQTASGDVTVQELRRGNLTSKNASGDIRVGIPAGIPVWTDVNTVTGRIASDLAGAGQPTGDQDHIELRATTVSGDINLKQL
ncbi:DUF4097 domain-containing protein [Nocardioides sp. JQ2195]|uniref:DUF4097 family beta strand repeat-containing protein n=1 Tax=Nocardioides sp. JQ2195 TaxID=2592334 RepID=UPI00143EA4CB|nr:DUF4097 family beta strand repeat-containing protein [Nocardioides sp. JQ2195]QIX25349.1 DUF4097 domain-containing protein [Nocardioides sp. JQ2195]